MTWPITINHVNAQHAKSTRTTRRQRNVRAERAKKALSRMYSRGSNRVIRNSSFPIYLFFLLCQERKYRTPHEHRYVTNSVPVHAIGGRCVMCQRATKTAFGVMLHLRPPPKSTPQHGGSICLHQRREGGPPDANACTLVECITRHNALS